MKPNIVRYGHIVVVKKNVMLIPYRWLNSKTYDILNRTAILSAPEADGINKMSSQQIKMATGNRTGLA